MTPGVNSKIWMTKYRSKKPFFQKLEEILLIDPFQVTSLRGYRVCVFQGAFVTS